MRLSCKFVNVYTKLENVYINMPAVSRYESIGTHYYVTDCNSSTP